MTRHVLHGRREDELLWIRGRIFLLGKGARDDSGSIAPQPHPLSR